MTERIPICDMHCDTAMELLAGHGLTDSSTQVNIPMMREANVALQLFACYIPPSIPPGKRAPLVLKMLDRIMEEIESNGEEIRICEDPLAASQALRSGHIGAVLTIENGMAIENEIKNLELFYRRGFRCLTIVHAASHDWAISSNDEHPKFRGLTAFGEDVIHAMNELGMIIDLSHSHDITVERVLSISSRPVVATHSCVHALCPYPRNVRDELIRGIADSGGMIGINFFPGFLDMNYSTIVAQRAGGLFEELSKMERKAGDDLKKISMLFQEFRVRLNQLMSDTRVSVDRIVDHIDYIIRLVGDDFVGFGSDFDGIPDFPEGVEDCRGFNLIREKLFERGYSEATVEKIAYRNFLRVFAMHG